MYIPLEPGFCSDYGATGKLFLLICYNVYLSHISNSSLIMSHTKNSIKFQKKHHAEEIICRYIFAVKHFALMRHNKTIDENFGNFGLRNGM